MVDRKFTFLGVFIVIAALLGVTAFVFTQGAFFQDIGCDFETVEHPDTGEKYRGSLEEAKSSYKEDFVEIASERTEASKEKLREMFDKREYRMQDGVLQVRNPELVCGKGSSR